jgi:hypothetical protein
MGRPLEREEADRKYAGMRSVEHPTAGLRRQQATFSRALIEGSALGLDPDVAKIHAVRQAYVKPHNPDACLRKANRLLRLGHVTEAVRLSFEARGFTREESIDWHIKHIRGEIERETLTRDGKVVRLTASPNYQALADYHKMTVPKQPKDVRLNAKIAYVDVTKLGEPGEKLIARSFEPMIEQAALEAAESEDEEE